MPVLKPLLSEAFLGGAKPHYQPLPWHATPGKSRLPGFISLARS